MDGKCLHQDMCFPEDINYLADVVLEVNEGKIKEMLEKPVNN